MQKLQEKEVVLREALSKSSGNGDRHTPWLPSAERDKENPELAATLRKVRGSRNCLAFALVGYCFVYMPVHRVSNNAVENHQTKMYLQVAINNEVIVALSNKNLANKDNMLNVWIDGVKRAGVKNALVMALDAETESFAKEKGIASFRVDKFVSLRCVSLL